MSLSIEEKNQYSRHILLDEIGLSGQLKLKQAKVLVIGAGGLGCPILQYLTAAGVGEIGIVDDDNVEQSNLQRQILYTHNDIGKSKAESAAKYMQLLNPFIQFSVFKTRLTKDNAVELFKKYDIVVDGTDNFPTRYLINDAAILAGKPVVFGAIYKFEGQVSVFNYKNGPSYRCLFPSPPKANEVPNCSEVGVLGVLPGIIGSFQANEVLKMICEIGTVLSGKLLTYNMLTMQQMVLSFKKNDSIQIKALDADYDFFCGLPKDTSEITLNAFQKKSEQYNLLDVREDDEREEYHIGGQHIPLGDLIDRLNEVAQDKDLVVYCKSGMRSKRAISILKENGYKKQLLNLKGGVFA